MRFGFSPPVTGKFEVEVSDVGVRGVSSAGKGSVGGLAARVVAAISILGHLSMVTIYTERSVCIVLAL